MIASLNNHQYRFVRLAALLFVCLLLGNVSLLAQTTQSPVPMPNPPTPVVDTADVIDAATEQRLNDILMNLSENKAANVEMGVVTVRTTGGRDIFEYSLAIMRGWGIGSSEKGGLLLVVAIDDRKYYTQVSRHLEGDIPDGLAGQIQRERLVPLFKQGNYNQAISDTVETYIATLAQKRGFSVEGIDKSRAYSGSQSSEGRPAARGFLKNNMFLIIIVVIIFLLISSRGGGGRGGCGGGGCLNFLFLNSLLNSGRGGWGSSGWGGGGGFGGGGGSSGGGWGGFSGGGGDAGGGGAGGSW